MARARRKRRIDQVEITTPTPEQFSKGEYHRANMAYRRKPMIDTLFDSGRINYRQYAALAYYRNQACQADDDRARSSTLAQDRVNGGGGGGSGLHVVFTSAIAEAGRIERALGSLCDITRAVAVDDVSLSQWCIRKYGGRERYDGKGNFVAIVPVREKKVVSEALFDLRSASKLITT